MLSVTIGSGTSGTARFCPTIFDQRGTIERPWPKLRWVGLVERFRTAVADVGLIDRSGQAKIRGAQRSDTPMRVSSVAECETARRRTIFWGAFGGAELAVRRPCGYNVSAMRNGRIALTFSSFQHNPDAAPTCLKSLQTRLRAWLGLTQCRFKSFLRQLGDFYSTFDRKRRMSPFFLQ